MFFPFDFLDNRKSHSLSELANFVSLPAMSGTVVVFVLCINALFDKTIIFFPGVDWFNDTDCPRFLLCKTALWSRA